MNAYDSDSSDESLTSATATTATLGYASRDPTADDFSQLGGSPTWPSSDAPSATFATCKSCSDIMPLLLQLNADLPEHFPGHERRLYIWGCRKRTCRRKEGAVKGLRGVKRTVAQQETRQNDKPAEQKPKQDMGAALFGGTANGSAMSKTSSNPLSTSQTPQQKSNPFATAPAPASSLVAKHAQKPPTYSCDLSDQLPQTFAEKARISDATASQAPSEPTKPWPQPSSCPQPYPKYHIDAETEYLSPPSTDQPANGESSKAYDAFLNTTDANEKSSSKDDALAESNHDKMFQHFSDVLSQNPEQVLRYDFEGRPLPYSSTDAVGRLFHSHENRGGMGSIDAKITTTAQPPGMPRCRRCGAERVFELQLCPHAISELETEMGVDEVMKEGLEWGAVFLGVCSQDCGDGKEGGWSWREEWVGVQWEEVVERRR